jgi:hypothetical protein
MKEWAVFTQSQIRRHPRHREPEFRLTAILFYKSLPVHPCQDITGEWFSKPSPADGMKLDLRLTITSPDVAAMSVRQSAGNGTSNFNQSIHESTYEKTKEQPHKQSEPASTDEALADPIRDHVPRTAPSRKVRGVLGILDQLDRENINRRFTR